MNITKASGKIVPFSKEKLETSLKRAGANSSTIKHIIEELYKELYQGIATKKIYQKALYKRCNG